MASHSQGQALPHWGIKAAPHPQIFTGGLKAASSSPAALLGWGSAQRMRADNGTKNGAHKSPSEQAGHGRQFSK